MHADMDQTENILADHNRPVLQRFAQSKLLLAFDFDGTLAPIVTQPEAAEMRASTRRLLGRVAERYPCVVISGRAREDVLRRVSGIPLRHVSGNHGLEPWAEKSRYVELVGQWATTLHEGLREHEGVIVEDKVYSVSVHYRMAPEKRRALRAISALAPSLRGARRIGGSLVVNFLPNDAPGKGDALERARRMLDCDTAIYVGDDDTDEAAFASAPARRLLGVRVGRRHRTHASYSIEQQADIDQLLRELVAIRDESR